MTDQAIILSGVAVSSLLIVGVVEFLELSGWQPWCRLGVILLFATMAIEYATVIAVLYFLARSRFAE